MDVSKSYLASVTAAAADTSNDHDGTSICDVFVTDLCLDGDFVIYANSNDTQEDSEADSATVRICDKILRAGEALDFSTTGN